MRTFQLNGRVFRRRRNLCGVWREMRQNNAQCVADRYIICEVARRHSADTVNRWWKKLTAALDRCEAEYVRVHGASRRTA